MVRGGLGMGVVKDLKKGEVYEKRWVGEEWSGFYPRSAF